MFARITLKRLEGGGSWEKETVILAPKLVINKSVAAN